MNQKRRICLVGRVSCCSNQTLFTRKVPVLLPSLLPACAYMAVPKPVSGLITLTRRLVSSALFFYLAICCVNQ